MSANKAGKVQPRAKKVESKRPKRTKVGRARDILTVENKDPSKMYRWVNDSGMNIMRHKDLGYEFVRKDGNLTVGEGRDNGDDSLGSVVTKEVGRRAPMTAYLMAIDKDLFNEYREEAEEEIQEIEETMDGSHQRDKIDGGYGTVKIE